MFKKSIIYPKNFFNDEEDEYELEGENIFDGDRINTGYNEGLGSFHKNYNNNNINKILTLRTEGDMLLNDSGIFKRPIAKQNNKLEIDYGGEDINISHDTSIESGLISKYISEKLSIFDQALMIFTCWQVIALVIYYETDFAQSDNGSTEYCLWLILILTAFEIVITFIRYKTQLEFEYTQKQISYLDDLITTKKQKKMIFEIVVLLLQPYPFLNEFTFTTYDYVDEIDLEFKWNWLLTIFGWFRVYIVFRVLLKSTIYLNTRASRISRMYGCQADYLYAIRCLFQDYPISISVIVFFISIFVFGYCLYICEKPLVLVLPKDSQTFVFDTIQNSIWCVIITMSTIGYGDFYPKTMLGRCLDVLLTVWGTFIVSLMIVIINNALTMNIQERRALLLLKRLESRKILKKKAALLLSGVIRYNNIEKRCRQKRKKLERSYYIQKSIDLRDKTKDFRDYHRKLKAMNEVGNLSEEMTREFDLVKQEVTILNDQQEKLCRYIEDNFDVEN